MKRWGRLAGLERAASAMRRGARSLDLAAGRCLDITRAGSRMLLGTARVVGSHMAVGAAAAWGGGVYAGRVAFLYAPVIAALLVGGLTYAAKLFDSFNLADNADSNVEKAVSLVTGPFYGGKVRQGQDAITVVLVNSETLADLRNPFWPLRYDHTASIVEAVAAMKPRAIFVDFHFSVPQPPRPCGAQMRCAQNPTWELDDLALRLDEVRAQGVPVLLGPVGPNPEFDALATIPQAGISLQDTRIYAYPMTSTQTALDGRPRPMAAAILYELWRKAEGPMARPAPGPDTVLALDWGFGMSSRMAEFSPEARGRATCRGGAFDERMASFSRLAVKGAFPTLAGPDALYMPCTYSDVVPAHAVLAPDLRAVLTPMMADRIVLIGADVPYLRDYNPTPLFGEAPGVMVHAMALDNLIERGPKATRYPPDFFMGLDWGDIVELALLIFGLLLIWLARAWRGVSYRRSLRWRYRIAIWLIVASIGVAVSCALYWPMFKLLGAAITGAGAMAVSDVIRQFFRVGGRHRALSAARQSQAVQP